MRAASLYIQINQIIWHLYCKSLIYVLYDYQVIDMNEYDAMINSTKKIKNEPDEAYESCYAM